MIKFESQNIDRETEVWSRVYAGSLASPGASVQSDRAHTEAADDADRAVLAWRDRLAVRT